MTAEVASKASISVFRFIFVQIIFLMLEKFFSGDSFTIHKNSLDSGWKFVVK